MTIKKRLFLSNILMIVVPAAIVAFVGLLCMALLWVTFQNGDSMRLEDREDLTRIGRDMADQIEGVMTDASDAWTSQMSSLESMTEDGTFRIVVTQNGGLAYVAGEEQPTDSQMVQAADIINETEAFISVGDRSVYRIDNTLSGGSWSLYLFGTRQEHLGSSLKVILALAAIGLIFIVFLTILMTNRFLTRFVVRRIEEPLDLLSDGARRLGDGDLDYRITYTGKDEFAPVCGAFNEMAARLKESVERTRRDEESRKELLAGISHDLRSPLTSIRAYVEGLLDGVAKTEEAKQRYLRTIHTKAEDIDRLVSQLFLYSKLDLEGVPMEMRPIRLDEFVAGFVEEAVFRGVFLSVLERRFHRWVGIVLPSVLFAALHLIGAQLDLAGAVQLLVSGSLVGILFSLVAVETGSIWCSALMHAVWNMVMVGGILHIGPSAQTDAVANYVLTGSSTLLTGGSFGVETSVIAMAAYAVFAGLAFWRCRRKGLL